MIDSISGTLQKKEPTFAIIDVGGIRMKLGITISTYERLPSTGNQSELLVYFHVREDILALYGFDNKLEERGSCSENFFEGFDHYESGFPDEIKEATRLYGSNTMLDSVNVDDEMVKIILTKLLTTSSYTMVLYMICTISAF